MGSANAATVAGMKRLVSKYRIPIPPSLKPQGLADAMGSFPEDPEGEDQRPTLGLVLALAFAAWFYGIYLPLLSHLA